MTMLRIASLIFALLVSWSACAQVPLTGAGKGAPGTAAPAYAFISGTNFSGSGNVMTVAAPLGSNPTCVIVVAVDMAVGTGNAFSSIQVNGAVNLTQDSIQQSNGSAAVFSGSLGNCAGSQNVVLTTTGASFVQRDMYIWVLTNLSSATVKHIGGYTRGASTNTPASPTINVTAADFMFSALLNISGVAPACAASTQAASNTNTTRTQSAGADWTISATNASFSLNCQGTASDGTYAFATYH